MDIEDNEPLDLAYLTIDDFLNSRSIRVNDVDQTRSADSLYFHFNKPGFDLAIIITDSCLIPTIGNFQTAFQSKHGFTTHVIYVPDVSRLKYCIRDLKLHEILYAIVVNDYSYQDDDYDVFVLTNIIELQRRMCYVEAVELINNDFLNYSEQLRSMFKAANKCPHPDNTGTEGFICPSDKIRYLLCLLFDNRMLKLEELQAVRSFVQLRKEALRTIGTGRSINYRENERPIPPYRKDTLKYYVYEPKQPTVEQPSIKYHPVNQYISNNMQNNQVVPMRSDTDILYVPPPPIGQPRVLPNPNMQMIHSPANRALPMSATIAAAPQLYGSALLPKPNVIHPNNPAINLLPNINTHQPPPNMNLYNASSSAASGTKQLKGNYNNNFNQTTNQPSFKQSTLHQPLPSRVPPSSLKPIGTKPPPQTTASAEVMAQRKIKFAIKSLPKPSPVTHSNVIHSSTNNDSDIDMRGPQKSSINKTSAGAAVNVDCTLQQDKGKHIQSSDNYNSSDGKDYQTLSYHLSPVSNASSEKAVKIEIDLTDEVCEAPAKKARNYRSPGSPQPKIVKASSNKFLSLFKFVLNLSPLSLPADCVVLQLLKTCLADMEKFIRDNKLHSVIVDIRSCRSGGCQEIVKIIESLTQDFLNSQTIVSDLNFMWTYFPRTISQDSVNIIFYKLMKMLESSKSISTSSDIVLNMLNKLQRVVNYDFQLSDSRYIRSNIVNYFPSLFTECYKQKLEFHNLNLSLQPQEPSNVVANPDLDKSYMESKIKFVVGPLIEYFIETINSIHYQLNLQTMGVIYGCVRTLRFCLRKICVEVLPKNMSRHVQFVEKENLMDNVLELLEEINIVEKEVNMMNCVLFTKKHYEFVNILLDFAVKVEKTVTEGSDSDMCSLDKESLIYIDAAQFLSEMATSVNTAVLPYDPDTEIEVFKRALKSRWTGVLHQAFRGVPPEPDGSRLSKEVLYLLPKNWGKHTFEEAVVEAATLSYNDWEKMLLSDFAKARVTYSDVRNNYLMWLSHNQLDHRKATEKMTGFQKLLDAKILTLSK